MITGLNELQIIEQTGSEFRKSIERLPNRRTLKYMELQRFGYKSEMQKNLANLDSIIKIRD